MNKKLHIVSLGCTKNLVDTEVMMGRLQDYKLTQASDDADVIIVNTCGFIDAAKEESINTMLELDSNRKSDSTLVMAGCLSERYKEDLQKELTEVDLFTGVGDYDKIDELIAKKENRFSHSTFLVSEQERVITGSSSHAYIKIAEGCNQTCSFCAIPSFKGKLFSRNLESIAKEVQNLIKKGYYDFSFVAQDSSSYGRDNGLSDGLISLVKEVEKIDGIKSARILYLYPSTTSMKLIEQIGESKIFHNYFDMPIQHINDVMLKRMKRGFGKEKTIELLNTMKALPNSFVRTSVIVGHPRESDEEFNEMTQFLEEFKFDRLNIFAYSDEEDTTSFEMEEKVDEETMQERLDTLQELSKNLLDENLQNLIGTELEIIVESESDEHEYLLSARALNWAPEIDGEIYVNDTNEKSITFGSVYKARITEIAGDKPLATLL